MFGAGPSSRAPAKLDVLAVDGHARGELRPWRSQEPSAQRAGQLDIWEDEGGASARPTVPPGSPAATEAIQDT